MATTTEDGTVQLWDANSGLGLRQLKGGGKVSRLRFSRDSEKVLAASRDGNARLWSAESGQLLGLFPHGHSLLDAAFTREDALITTCSLDNDFVVWDAVTGNVVNRMCGNGRSLSIVDFAPDGSRMVTATNGEFFQVWDPLWQTGRRLIDFGRPSYPAFAVSEKAGLIAKLDTIAGLQLVALDGSGRRQVLTANPLFLAAEQGVALTIDGARMAVVLDCFTPSVWDLPLGDFVQLKGHEAEVRSIAFDSTGERVVTASVDGTARIWEAKSGQTLAILEGHNNAVNSATFSPDDKSVLTASADGTAVIWDTESARQSRTLRGHSGGVRAAAFSADGRRAFTASEDRTVRVWDVSTGEEVKTLRGHSDTVTGVSFTLDSHFILASSSDGTSRIWDTAEMEPLLILPGICRATYLPSISALITAQQDGRVERWEAASLSSPEAPDPSAATDHTGYMRYQALDHAKAEGQLIPSVTPERIVAISSRQTLVRCLQELLEQLGPVEAIDVSELGLSSSSGPSRRGPLQALKPLGLQGNDLLIQVSGVEINKHPNVASLLGSAISDAENKTLGRLNLVILRNGCRIPVSILTRECEVLSRTITLKRGEALSVIHILLDVVVGRTSTSQASIPASSADCVRQSTGANEDFLIDVDQPDSGTLAQLLEASLAPYDLVTSIDNRPLRDTSETGRLLKQLHHDIGEGKANTFWLDIRRGEFLLLHVQYVLN